MKVQDFVNLISSCGFSPIPYSGHAMFGRQCVGVEMPIHGSIDFVKAMIANVPNDS